LSEDTKYSKATVDEELFSEQQSHNPTGSLSNEGGLIGLKTFI
jgi:hypothetical protein